MEEISYYKGIEVEVIQDSVMTKTGEMCEVIRLSQIPNGWKKGTYSGFFVMKFMLKKEID